MAAGAAPDLSPFWSDAAFRSSSPAEPVRAAYTRILCRIRRADASAPFIR